MNLMLKTQSLEIDFSEKLQFLRNSYSSTRNMTTALCQPITLEQYDLQSMADVSPPKWHLAHTTWFFEKFVLVPFAKEYKVFDAEFDYLFNSYYKGLGNHYPREKRGLIKKPDVQDIYEYRLFVDKHLQNLSQEIGSWNGSSQFEFLKLLELGIEHEQQHQELLMMDILHIFYSYFFSSVYSPKIKKEAEAIYFPLHWHPYSEGIYEVGASKDTFSFDNENPRHRVFLENFALASRLVTNAEYLEFVQDGGYKNPLLWLSDGWDWVQTEKWNAPLYWVNEGGDWLQMTLNGPQKIEPYAPVCHVSYFEADAYARWRGKRLPREEEWEIVADGKTINGVFLESNTFQPQALKQDSFSFPSQLWGDVWEWTQSAYLPYPGFKPFAGNLGEYNGKFMCNQFVLRGGSCVSPQNHLRASYRNFFPPKSRWQFSGIRLAEDA